jgi:hypothetical protein
MITNRKAGKCARGPCLCPHGATDGTVGGQKAAEEERESAMVPTSCSEFRHLLCWQNEHKNSWRNYKMYYRAVATVCLLSGGSGGPTKKGGWYTTLMTLIMSSSRTTTVYRAEDRSVQRCCVVAKDHSSLGIWAIAPRKGTI